MKKTKIYLSIAVAVTVLVVLVSMSYLSNSKDFSTIIALGCDATRYEQKLGIGYLTINYPNSIINKEITIKVEDVTLQNDLSTADLNNLIGLNLNLTIPSKVLREQHIDVVRFNPFEYLNSGTYDDNLVLLAVFYR